LSAADKLAAPPAPVPTPCIDVCTMDEAAGLCLGCARTAEEIGAWLEADAGFKRAVWDALPARRARLQMPAYRLPWSAAQSAEFMETALRSGAGRWRLGIHGAAADFAAGPDGQAEITSDADAITAISSCGAVRLLKHQKTIAIAFRNRMPPAAGDFREKAPSPGAVLTDLAALSREGRGLSSAGREALPLPELGRSPLPSRERADAEGGRVRGLFAEVDAQGDAEEIAQAIAFVLPRGRVRLEKSMILTSLGPDRDAVLEQHRETTLYDTGFGGDLAVRICLRTADPQLTARDLMSRLTTDEVDATFEIVIETGLGRAELFAPVDPRWFNTHHLAAARETPPGWDLRPVFALGALFYPGGG
jgi:predicted Fe-S protein YdhL (DUF1289 family)